LSFPCTQQRRHQRRSVVDVVLSTNGSMHAVCSQHTGLTMWVLALPLALNRIDDTNHQAGRSQEQLHRGHFSRVADPSWTAADLRRNPIHWLFHLTRIDPLATNTKPHRRGLEVHYLDLRRRSHQDPRRVHRNPAGLQAEQVEREGFSYRELLEPANRLRLPASSSLCSVSSYTSLFRTLNTLRPCLLRMFFCGAPGLRSILFARPLFINLGVAKGVSVLGGLSVIDWYFRYVWSLDLRREVESEIEVRDFVT
jgi:hypothetical protein